MKKLIIVPLLVLATGCISSDAYEKSKVIYTKHTECVLAVIEEAIDFINSGDESVRTALKIEQKLILCDLEQLKAMKEQYYEGHN